MSPTIERIRATLSEFQQQSCAWEEEVWALLDEPSQAPPTSHEGAGLGEKVEAINQALLDRHLQLLQRHDEFSADLQELRLLLGMLHSADATAGIPSPPIVREIAVGGDSENVLRLPVPDRDASSARSQAGPIRTEAGPERSYDDLIDALLAQLATCEGESADASAGVV